MPRQAKPTYRKLTLKWGIPKAKTVDVVLDFADVAPNPLNAEKCVQEVTPSGIQKLKTRYWYLQVKEPDSDEWKYVMHIIYWIPTDNPSDKVVRFIGPVEDAIKECKPIMNDMVHQYAKNASKLEFRLQPYDIEVVAYPNSCVSLNWKYSRMTIV